MSVEQEIVIEFEDRHHFLNALKENPGWIIVKFTATWCRPCKTVKSTIEEHFSRAPDNVVCCDLDVDENIDLYAFLKSVKQVNGIPALLAYHKSNVSFAPNFSCGGSDKGDIQLFFDTVYNDSNL